MITFVLLHGAYQGGWIFNPVAERLRAQGHLVFAPTLDGCGERKHQVRKGITTETHADEVAALLFYQDLKNVVLVGTSTGGMVMARAAELARPPVAHQRRACETLKGRWHELDTGHYPMLSEPAALARLIVDG